MKKIASYKNKKVLYLLITVLVFIGGFFALRSLENKKYIDAIEDFIKDETKVVYISDDENYSNYPIELLNKYEIKKIYINSSNLSGIEKSKLEALFNTKYLNNIIIIFEDGNIKDAIIEYESKKKLLEFFQRNGILPEQIEDIGSFFNTVENAINKDANVLYISYKKENSASHDIGIIDSVCTKNEINYEVLNAYLLSFEQQMKLNKMLEISDVEDHIIVFIKNNSIVGSNRDKVSKSKFEKALYDFNLILDLKNDFNDVNIDDLSMLIASDLKNVIFIGKEDCKYCDDSMKVLSDLISEYDIQINYLNIKSLDGADAEKLNDELEKIGYEGGLSIPLIIITESNKLLTHMIGVSTYDYYLGEFKEFGIIK